MLGETRLDASPLVAAVAHPGAGAIDVFYGVVREHSEGRQVTRLEYSAYESMALAEMRRIARGIEQGLGVRVAVAHRLGSLDVGEVAVICAASAAHRGEAFAACRRLIDEIKHDVPIWKREFGPDGTAWVGWVDARCHAHGGPEDSISRRPPEE
jgi:molybdopterin synthase catalytic subunit